MLLLLLVEEKHRSRFEELYRFYKHRVYNYTYGILQDVGLAEDSVQETFIVLAKYMDGIMEIDCKQTGALVRLVAHNTAKTYRTKQSRQQKRDRDYGGKHLQNLDPNPVQDTAEYREQIRTIEKHIDELPEVYRDVILLYAMGYSHKKIGQILRIKTATSRKRLERARAMLRQASKEVRP